jgi:amino acid adenylation domain-containing protein
VNRIMAIWSEILDRRAISADDNFFMLGANSLAAQRAVARIREEFQVSIPLRALFEAPTADDLALLVAAADAAAEVPDKPEDTAPTLAFEQERLWVLDQLRPGSSAYNLSIVARFRGRLDVDTLARCLHEIIQRHEVLRTVFSSVEGRPEPRVLPSLRVPVPLADLSGLDEDEARQCANAHAVEQAREPFDLATGPLLRARVLRFGDSDFRLLLTLHHIVTDGWSDDIIIRELNSLYTAYTEGGPYLLPRLLRQYSDWAARQRAELTDDRLADLLSWWHERLSGAPHLLELPTDLPRPAVQRFVGARHDFEFPPAFSQRLADYAREEGVTLFMVLLAGFSVLLHRYANQDDIIVGTPVANRSYLDTEQLIGFFVNTVALRCNLRGRPRFRDLLGRVRETVLESFARQEIPFGKLVEAIAPRRSPAYTPLIQVMLALQNTPDRDGKGADPGPFVRETEAVDSGGTMFDLTLFLTQTASAIRGSWEYNTDLFLPERIAGMGEQLETLLGAAMDDPDQAVSLLPLVDRDKQNRIVQEWNATQASWPMECVHELLRRQARLTPDAVAVEIDGVALTYERLDRDTDALARWLRRSGVRTETIVAVACERSLEMVTALLGVLKAGAAYLPLDPDNPPARNEYVLTDSGTRLLLTLSKHRRQLPQPGGVTVVCLDELPLAQEIAEELSVGDPDQLAYLIYTSGSTGKPKGVLSQHGPVSNRIRWAMATFPLRQGDLLLQKTPVHFDISVWEVFWPLSVGATVVLARPDGHRDPEYLSRTIAERGITDVHFVPSGLPAFLQRPDLGACTKLRRIYCSGEALAPALQEQVFARLPQVELHNLYGPTEAAIEVTHWQCRPGTETVPIGRPIGNARTYVLDPALRPVPPGVPGELYLGGWPPARGYHGRPELTAQRFLPDPFGEAGTRMYRPGDRAQWRPDGTVEYLGRNDNQIKLRGYRIELGEIEAVLGGHPDVAAVVVVVHQTDDNDQRLVGYVVPGPNAAADTEVLVARLRQHLTDRLPSYMRPVTYVCLDRFPLTPSGKTDRSALPAPTATDIRTGRPVTPPGTPVERELAQVWSQVLGVTRIGVDDNFFELGGHSLLAAQMIYRVAAVFHVDLPIRVAFELSTLGQLALRIVRAQAERDEEQTARLLAEIEALSDDEARRSADGVDGTE